MTLCGVWHGAGWPFLLWGFYHGCLIAGYHISTYRQRTAAPAADVAVAATPVRRLAALLTTFALVSLGWIFFRSATTEQALGLVERALMPWEYSYRALSGTFYLHAAVLTLAVWAAPLAARWFVRAASADDAARDGWLRLLDRARRTRGRDARAVLDLSPRSNRLHLLPILEFSELVRRKAVANEDIISCVLRHADRHGRANLRADVLAPHKAREPHLRPDCRRRRPRGRVLTTSTASAPATSWCWSARITSISTPPGWAAPGWGRFPPCWPSPACAWPRKSTGPDWASCWRASEPGDWRPIPN